jgi:hypothetical protein
MDGGILNDGAADGSSGIDPALRQYDVEGGCGCAMAR